MINIKNVRRLNMYFIPLFLGMIVFMQIELFPSGTGSDIENQAMGLNLFTAILLNLTTLLIVATVPKKNKLLRLINWIFKKKWDDKTIESKADMIDSDMSIFVYYVFSGLMIVFSIVSIILLFTF